MENLEICRLNLFKIKKKSVTGLYIEVSFRWIRQLKWNDRNMPKIRVRVPSVM